MTRKRRRILAAETDASPKKQATRRTTVVQTSRPSNGAWSDDVARLEDGEVQLAAFGRNDWIGGNRTGHLRQEIRIGDVADLKLCRPFVLCKACELLAWIVSFERVVDRNRLLVAIFGAVGLPNSVLVPADASAGAAASFQARKASPTPR